MNGNAFHDLGIPVQADEERTAAVCTNPAGETRIVIAARGYALIVHPETGDCRQVPYPDQLVDYPFASMSSRTGLFYTGAGRLFMVLDPFDAAFVHYGVPAPDEEIIGFAFAEDEAGMVYATTYPGCWLLRHDPAKGLTERLFRLDPDEKYATSLAAGADGWIYAGIGTERKNIVAYHPASGTSRQLVPEDQRTRGAGHVHRGKDGAVYGHYSSSQLRYEEGRYDWFRFEGGSKRSVDEGEVHPSLYRGTGFQTVHRDGPDGMFVRSISLSDRELVIAEPKSGEERLLQLRYESRGANLSPLTVGPDGNIYGTSNHPLHFYAFMPAENKLVNYGGKAVERGGGGNICAYAVQAGLLAGAAYAGGHIHLFDPGRPVSHLPDAGRNPKLVASSEDIYRPRCAIAHPDGEHVVFGGFAGYGAVGGALGIYNVRSGDYRSIPNRELVPDQSTLCLVCSEEGDLIGGTSIETPGGAQPKAAEAEIYVLDWRTKTVRMRWVPVPGAREISLMVLDDQSRLHLLTSDSQYVVIDYETKRQLYSRDLSEYGGIVRDGLATAADGTIYGLLSRGIFRVDSLTFNVDILAMPPGDITAGMALTGDSIYFATGSRLWRYAL